MPTIINQKSLQCACLAMMCLVSAVHAALARSKDAGLTKPSIPAHGAYLGAWVNPQGLPGQRGAAEIQQLPRFDNYMGKELSIFHVYVQFTDSFPTTSVASIQQDGSTPLLDWDCTDIDQINNGG